jgi:hypothetical protein
MNNLLRLNQSSALQGEMPVLKAQKNGRHIGALYHIIA